MNLTHLEHTKDEFIKIANSQEQKGIEKYGKPLDPMDDYDWLDMEFEELVDAAKYNRAMKQQLKKIDAERNFAISKLRRLVDNDGPKDEINHWLDVLVGDEG